ncbi:myeloid-derived growth factor isoform X1 [Ailuropoda melanoleuca]|uniref:myeloid-derived growth factor isoform X1 n=1 Tax=Ailuropoda melanoleuca TaxID=9646 RepID=UPI0014950321|nr:myeloid-derived growth factor isoform X1 [Ailuropoda melanoleuca]
MAAPSGRRNGGGARLWAALLLAAAALRPAEAVSEPTTVAFDVRPGGVVHSFSQNVGPGDKYTCAFTYASQGGTNEKWQMSLGTSEDHQHFTCTIWRPQGKSYLYFTQFKAEVRGAEIEYGMAYSKAAFERESDVPLKSEEFEVTKTADFQGWRLSMPSPFRGLLPCPAQDPERLEWRGPDHVLLLSQCPTGPGRSRPSCPSW